MEFLRSFLRRHLAGKPVVASPNVGCFLRLVNLTGTTCTAPVHSPSVYYLLKSLGRRSVHGFSFFQDHDECKNGQHTCSQICGNTPGSYYCACRPGYYLDGDFRTCKGMLNIHAALITKTLPPFAPVILFNSVKLRELQETSDAAEGKSKGYWLTSLC